MTAHYTTPPTRLSGSTPSGYDILASGIAGIELSYALERRLTDRERAASTHIPVETRSPSRVRGWLGTHLIHVGQVISGADAHERAAVPAASPQLGTS